MNEEAYVEMAKTEEDHWWYAARRKIISQIIKHTQLPKKSVILEIGCGTGGNLKMLSTFGQTFGVEMNEEATQIAAKKLSGIANVQSGYCPDNIPFKSERFDLICMLDVLEHIDDDVQTLINVKTLLADKGTLIVTVPAYQWLWSRHDEFVHHKRRYTITELNKKIVKAGFTPVKKSYFNSFLFPLVVAGRIKDQLIPSKEIVGIGVPNFLLNSTLTFIFGLERIVLRFLSFPFGTSVVFVLKKA